MTGAPANKDRGEHGLVLGGRTYRLRPSFTAIQAIEAGTGRALVALARAGNLGELTLKQIGLIAAEMIRAGADEKDELTRQVSSDRIAEMCFEAGVPAVMARVTLALVDAATGGRTAEGEAKAPAATS